MHATAAVVQQQKQGSKTPPGGRSGEFFFGGHGWRAMWSRKPTSVNTGLQSGAMVKRYQARRRRHGIPTMSLCGESSGAAAVPHVCVTAILYTEIECGRHVWRFGTAAHSSQKPQHLSLQKPDVPPEALTSLDGSVLSWAIASPPSPSLSRKLFLGCWRVVSSACPDSAERVCCCRTPYRSQKTHA